ncbi:MAG: RNA-protein complex protein Nop10 [Candidatus Altiarchaeales archaeon]|nr:RNA-protein complex protein Nop10 [Candidatus Altiarchaeales archaeon]MBD3415764.1 RNA-protein complex protein Nop10 [Candidatus Altiarchaeales archaeon]
MRIRKCPECGGYTLKESCGKCNVKSSQVGPARYSPEDPYGCYRRQMKEQMGHGRD